MGGRGKTPMAAFLARLLLDAGERPAILSRGYGRHVVEPGVVVVSDGARILADLASSGDEPMLLAREVPGAIVAVCEDRALAGTLAERALGATVHLLDDGFQHLALARDIDLVIVADADLAGRALPFGRLREPVGALAAADAILIDGDSQAAARLGPPAFTLVRSHGTPVSVQPGPPWPPDRFPVVAVAGIADPTRFYTMLEAEGWRLADRLTFKDHHRYGAADIARIAGAVRSSGASGVLTTSKDAVRLTAVAPLPVPVAAVPLAIHITPGEPFREWLFGRLREARA